LAVGAEGGIETAVGSEPDGEEVKIGGLRVGADDDIAIGLERNPFGKDIALGKVQGRRSGPVERRVERPVRVQPCDV
jgi:hypothetical protein